MTFTSLCASVSQFVLAPPSCLSWALRRQNVLIFSHHTYTSQPKCICLSRAFVLQPCSYFSFQAHPHHYFRVIQFIILWLGFRPWKDISKRIFHKENHLALRQRKFNFALVKKKKDKVKSIPYFVQKVLYCSVRQKWEAEGIHEDSPKDVIPKHGCPWRLLLCCLFYLHCYFEGSLSNKF